ncbi:hypothetical protein CPB85DRAFT_890392 [Mucidula mucida]|nr:hypothetical protein CPB85DRAFT_890392 [Mucidula mucida]
MPKFLARFRRRSVAAAEPTESSAATETRNTPPVRTADLGQKIHPDLDELVSTFTAPPPPVATPRAPIVDDAEGSIIPLKPAVARPRRKSGDARSPRTSANSPTHPTSPPELDTTNKNELTQGSNESLVHTPPPGSPQSPAPPSSWSTFGRKALKGAKSIPNIIDRSRSSTIGSRSTQSRTPASTLDGVPDPLTPYASISSGSMPSSGFTFGHGRIVPPLPPLDHPAFSGDASLDVGGLPVSLKDDREVVQFLADKQPRPSISLPSMPSSSGCPG